MFLVKWVILCVQFFLIFFMEMVMADKVTKVEFSGLDVQWVMVSLEAMTKVIQRKISSEFAGSDVIPIRHRELAEVQSVLQKVRIANG